MMLRIRCKEMMEGPGPDEKVVQVETVGGAQEEVVVDRRSIYDGGLEVGGVSSDRGSLLVELPRESASGNWRIWVPASAQI